MASFKERVTARVEAVRERYPVVDHLVRTVQHYGNVEGNSLAGAVTFFGFLSFFPILALSFFAVGQLSKVYDASNELERAINSFLPGIVGDQPGEIPLSTFEQNAAAIGLIGLVGLLYSGLGWLSGMRNALEVVFEMPKREQPNFVFGKLRDLASLVTIGVVMLISVGISGLLAAFSKQIFVWLSLDDTPVSWLLLQSLSVVLGIAATTLMFLAIFKLLVDPDVPRRSLLTGAILGGIGFEILKKLSVFLIALTKESPSFQAFGIALILLVWINYASRLVMLSAAWTYTSPAALEQRTNAALRAPGAALQRVEGAESERPDHEAAAGDRATTESAEVGPSALEDGPSQRPPVGSHRAAPVGRGRLLALGSVVAAVVAWVVLVARRRVGDRAGRAA